MQRVPILVETMRGQRVYGNRKDEVNFNLGDALYREGKYKEG